MLGNQIERFFVRAGVQDKRHQIAQYFDKLSSMGTIDLKR